MTVQDLINLAVGLIGGTTQGEGSNASEFTDSFLRLNLLIDGWNADPQNQFGTLTTSITLSGAVYTIGVGGTFNIARPAFVKSVRALVAGRSSDMMPMNKPQYNAIEEPGQTGIWPKRFYDDGLFPTRTMRIWPVPSTSGTIEIDTPFAIPQFAALTDNVVLPPAFAKALVYNLAVDLAAAYGLQLNSPEITAIAVSSKADMQKPAMITAQGAPVQEMIGIGRGEPMPPASVIPAEVAGR